MRKLNYFSLLLLLLCPVVVVAQQPEKESNYDKYEAFSPLFLNGQTNAFHSATGNPGPKYWQNMADYDIEATLRPDQHKLDGKVTIHYTNNSPYNLNFLWLQLDQNTFKKGSRSSALYPPNDRNGIKTFTDGYELESVKVDGEKVEYKVVDTRLQIRLSEAVDKDGDDVDISIDYSFKIPEHGKDRMGRVETKNGWLYTLAQWYPRMAVYDEVEGWNTLPYLGTGEFYLEFGDYDYKITAPDDMLIAGAGELENPDDVLTDKMQDRLDKAYKSDETVMIRTQEEMENNEHKEGDNGMLTWHFTMEKSHDVAWAASKAFIWDAAKLNIPNKDDGLAQSLYPVENSGEDGYARSTEYTKRSVEIYSDLLTPYTYPVATNVGGHEGGMEYPGIVFCDYQSQNSDLWGVINHEFGHNWFPMLVGSNERKYAWFDEGFNTYINTLTTKRFNDGEYYEESNPQQLANRLFDDNLDPVFTVPDVIHNQANLGIEAYYKPSTALQVLREVVLGKDRFDYAFNEYIDRWKYKHPQPWDFFNTMSDAAGEDLGWFWKGWIMNNWKLDQEVDEINYVDGDASKGSLITVRNNGEMVMPLDIKVTEKGGNTIRKKLPVEIWLTGAEYVVNVPSTREIVSVTIDPDNNVPDVKPVNNTKNKVMDAPQGMNAKDVLDKYFAKIGGQDKLNAIKSVSKKGSTSIQGTKIEITEMKKSPDKYAQVISVPSMGRDLMHVTLNGDEGKITNRGQTQTLNKDQLKAFEDEATIFPETNYMEKGYSSELTGAEYGDNGEELYIVKTEKPSGETVKTYFNGETGLKVKAVTEMNGQKSSTEYGNYKKVDGIIVPHMETSDKMGRKMKLQLDSIEFNKGIDNSKFTQ